METTEIFERLKTLQNILVQKYDLEAKIEEAPKQLSSQEELLSRLKKEFIVKNADYETIKDKVLKLRAELEEAIKSREAGEKGMDNITTHREYEALEKQILEATDKENEIRKELQIEEKSLEETKENLKDVVGGFKNKFPFCIPWDLQYLYSILADNPKTPVFKLPLVLERYGIHEDIVIDMSNFEGLSKISRLFFTLLYIYGLINFTVKVVLVRKEE